MKNIGKPDAGKLHVRFDEGGLGETCSLLYPHGPQQRIWGVSPIIPTKNMGSVPNYTERQSKECANLHGVAKSPEDSYQQILPNQL